MTTPAAIEVNHISKIYRLYPSRQSRMIEMVHPLRQKMHRRFQALNDINFSVQKGEVVGLIGQNGSGKSTILKILSSVITPTSGSFTCNGRVTSLLELGGGFDMNLTGIENVYFIGAIQGYRKKQMEERMDQILEFAEIGDYANQPVKNYSSGMYVRLAFSININIDPEILIIDEALAVGDMRFQQKCFRKIREFKDLGKTIIICSHSMGAIRDFCTRTIWLNHGRLMADGEPKLVTDQFRDFMAQQDMAKAAERMAQHANLSS
ncbi:MAG: ABC transporter ATP-binding protein, partial [Bacteroidales bacterium]